MIIRIKGRDDTVTHFNLPRPRAPQLIRWNHDIYVLVSAALDPLPTYVLLPPLVTIQGDWHCQSPETADQ